FLAKEKRSKANFATTRKNQKCALKGNARKKVVVSQRRNECACKRIAVANVPFCEKGGARKRADVFLAKEKRSKANFAPTLWHAL
ncbi:MAG: hypothetical protein SPF92_07280, partial [Clostridia bacterium]|nr:hypothetical protein [Clostridia bacterium]